MARSKFKRMATRTWRQATRKPRRELRRRFGAQTMTPAQRKAQFHRERRAAQAAETRRRREIAAAKKKAAAQQRRDKATQAAERARQRRFEAAERARIARMRAKKIGTGRVDIVVGGDRVVGARLKTRRSTKMAAAPSRPPRPGQPAAGVQRVGRVQGVAARTSGGGRGARRPAALQKPKTDPRWSWDDVQRKRKSRKRIVGRMLPEGRKSAIPHFGKRRHDPNGIRNCRNCKGYGLVNALGDADKNGQIECPECGERRDIRQRSFEIAARLGLPRRRMRG